MSRLLSGTRYLVILPVLGLAVAAALIFVLGGIGLIGLIYEMIAITFGFSHEGAEPDKSLWIVEIIEFVHTFLVGTVIYITAIGLYQLFISELALPHWLDWLKIENTEELETNLISVTVVVLAVNFMGEVLVGSSENLLEVGAGIALPIAALALFVGLRAWATKTGKKSGGSGHGHKSPSGNEPAVQGAPTEQL